jgi:hypothetical protein
MRRLWKKRRRRRRRSSLIQIHRLLQIHQTHFHHHRIHRRCGDDGNEEAAAVRDRGRAPLKTRDRIVSHQNQSFKSYIQQLNLPKKRATPHHPNFLLDRPPSSFVFMTAWFLSLARSMDSMKSEEMRLSLLIAAEEEAVAMVASVNRMLRFIIVDAAEGV